MKVSCFLRRIGVQRLFAIVSLSIAVFAVVGHLVRLRKYKETLLMDHVIFDFGVPVLSWLFTYVVLILFMGIVASLPLFSLRKFTGIIQGIFYVLAGYFSVWVFKAPDDMVNACLFIGIGIFLLTQQKAFCPYPVLKLVVIFGVFFFLLKDVVISDVVLVVIKVFAFFMLIGGSYLAFGIRLKKEIEPREEKIEKLTNVLKKGADITKNVIHSINEAEEK